MGALIPPMSSLCNSRTGHGIVLVSSEFPLSTREQSVSLDLNSSMPLLARMLYVSCFYLLVIGFHGLGSQRLYLLPPGAVWHSSQ